MSDLANIAELEVQAGEPEPVGIATWGTLTNKEREVVRWVAAGRRNREVAELMGISTQTVKNYLRSIFDKLGVWDRCQMVAMYWRGRMAARGSMDHG